MLPPTTKTPEPKRPRVHVHTDRDEVEIHTGKGDFLSTSKQEAKDIADTIDKALEAAEGADGSA